MKVIKFILCAILIPFLSLSQTSDKIVVHGNLQLTNNGIAPVPTFSLGRPAALSTITISKGRFFYNPEVNIGLDLKPWAISSRLGYVLFNKDKWTFSIAASLAFYFAEQNPIVNNEEFQVQRYLGKEFYGQYRISKNRVLDFLYWNNVALDNVGIKKGHFAMAIFSFNHLAITDKSFINFKPSIFYLNNSLRFNGLFVSQTTTFQKTDWKANIFLQFTQPIAVLDHQGSFLWNTGVNVPF